MVDRTAADFRSYLDLYERAPLLELGEVADRARWTLHPEQVVTYIIPLRYFLEIVRGIFLKGAGLAELWPQAIALLGLGLFIFSLAVSRFRKTLA